MNRSEGGGWGWRVQAGEPACVLPKRLLTGLFEKKTDNNIKSLEQQNKPTLVHKAGPESLTEIEVRSFVPLDRRVISPVRARLRSDKLLAELH